MKYDILLEEEENLIFKKDLAGKEEKLKVNEHTLTIWDIKDIGLYFKPKEVCSHLNIPFQIDIIKENKTMKNNFFIEGATGDIWLNLSYICHWLSYNNNIENNVDIVEEYLTAVQKAVYE